MRPLGLWKIVCLLENHVVHMRLTGKLLCCYKSKSFIILALKEKVLGELKNMMWAILTKGNRTYCAKNLHFPYNPSEVRIFGILQEALAQHNTT